MGCVSFSAPVSCNKTRGQWLFGLQITRGIFVAFAAYFIVVEEIHGCAVSRSCHVTEARHQQRNKEGEKFIIWHDLQQDKH
jgi:hypothetical protein